MKVLLLAVAGLAVSMIFTACGPLDGSAGGSDPLDGAYGSTAPPSAGARGYDGVSTTGSF
jgi:hypothetical protein